MEKGYVTGRGRETTATAIRHIIHTIGDDPHRDGLADTPDRVIESWKELFRGYGQDPKDVFKVFDGGHYDQMVLCKDIEIYSTCEHHMLPFFGHAHVAYIPGPPHALGRRVIGLSKLARLVDIFSRRLQMQERITNQVTAALMEHLQPLGAACVLECQHLCMCARGAGKQHSRMVTSSLTGVFKEKPEARLELLHLIGLGK
jgi:GTP cyclohydrolase I